jgi:hypothetical protein
LDAGFSLAFLLSIGISISLWPEADLRGFLDAFEAADAPTERLHRVDDVAVGGTS